LRYTQNGKRMWENVGSDCWVALDKKAGRERSLRDHERGAIPAGPLFTSQTHIALVDAVEQYTARVKAIESQAHGGNLFLCIKRIFEELQQNLPG